MVITYHGETYFKLQAGDLTVLIDPANQRSFKGANLILNTLKPALTPMPVEGDSIWVEHQGEYEVRGIEVRGWSAGQEKEKTKTFYRIIMDDLTVIVLGYADRLPSDDIQEYLSGADIALGPAVKGAVWVKQLEPAIIIPALSGKELDAFLKEAGEKTGQLLEKLVIKKKDIIPGKTKIVCLSS